MMIVRVHYPSTYGFTENDYIRIASYTEDIIYIFISLKFLMTCWEFTKIYSYLSSIMKLSNFNEGLTLAFALCQSAEYFKSKLSDKPNEC